MGGTRPQYKGRTGVTKKTSPPSRDAQDVTPISDLLQSDRSLPIDDRRLEHALRSAFTSELKPSGPYQIALIQHMVDAEMDIRRARDLRSSILRDAMATSAEEVLGIKLYPQPRDGWSYTTRALMDPDSGGHADALSALAERGVTLDDLMGRAYRIRSRDIEILAKEEERAHRRRKSLRAQYDALQKSDAVSDVEDAEVLEP